MAINFRRVHHGDLCGLLVVATRKAIVRKLRHRPGEYYDRNKIENRTHSKPTLPLFVFVGFLLCILLLVQRIAAAMAGYVSALRLWLFLLTLLSPRLMPAGSSRPSALSVVFDLLNDGSFVRRRKLHTSA